MDRKGDEIWDLKNLSQNGSNCLYNNVLDKSNDVYNSFSLLLSRVVKIRFIEFEKTQISQENFQEMAN